MLSLDEWNIVCLLRVDGSLHHIEIAAHSSRAFSGAQGRVYRLNAFCATTKFAREVNLVDGIQIPMGTARTP